MIKIKAEKQRYITNSKTLDETHNNIINEFKKKRNTLPILNAKLTRFENQLNKLTDKHDNHLKTVLKEKIARTKEQIYDIKNNVSEMEYYAKTYDILLDYYDIVDKNNEEVYNELECSKPQPVQPNNIKLAQLNELNKGKPMKIVKKRKPPPANKNNIINQLLSTNTDPGNNSNLNPTNDKSKLYDEFKLLIENEFLPTNVVRQHNYLKKCNNCNINKMLIQSEAIFVCTNCGEVDMVIIESENGSFKDSTPEKTAYPYKRGNHFGEWLSQIQAKESVEIPDYVYEKLMVEIKKLRITNLKRDLDRHKIKLFLKKLGMTNYYEHVAHILSKLTGLPPPSINRETEETLRRMFKQIQKPFDKHCPPERINFLSYSYCLHKFCELLELDEFIKCFPLLKSADKLKEQDKIWKKICEEVRWEYIPSI